MNQLPSLGVLFISWLSLGFGEKCCLHKQVGKFSYNHIASEDTTKFNCISDCVYSREGGNPANRYCFARGDHIPVCKNDSDNAMLHHAFYSDLSYFHCKLKDLLSPEQAGLVSLPASCSQSDYEPPNYCWHGKYVNSDDGEYPPGSYIDYRDSIVDILKYLSSGAKKSLSNACSMVRIDCYGECLPQILDEAAKCLNGHWWDLPSCIGNATKVLEKDCGSCFCELLNLLPLLKKVGVNLICEKEKPISSNCDRDCANSLPKQCVFNFTLEVLKTDADGRRADGRLRSVVAYNGQIPGPPIVICEGDELVVNFKNNIDGRMTNADGSTNTTTLHFHGIREKSRPWSDGVPFVTQCPIQPGDPTFQYGFNASDVDGAPPGTYWYHSHVGSQRTNGAYGALIIKERVPDTSFVDDAANTLVLQEWYESSTKQTPVSILINGKGRVGEKKMSGEDDEILNYLKGKGGNFQCIENEYFNDNFSTNYSEFNVNINKSYRFRIIGAISQNFPLQLSIEDHKFTAIAMDSLDIHRVPDLTNVWLAAGERYDIVVQTKPSVKNHKQAYKIKILGYADILHKQGPICSIAWLKYPTQTINYNYVTPCDCSDFDHSSTGNTLNPVPNNYTEWEKSPGNGKIFIKDVKSIKKQPTIHFDRLANLNTHYIEFVGNITFNNRRMKYPDVPFLLQNPENKADRCGSKCDLGVGKTANQFPYLYTNCSEFPECPANAGSSEEDYCKCQHVIQQPWAPGYWAETVLINNNLNHAAAHPIHQHGGWYWVVGMGKYNHTINRTLIMAKDGLNHDGLKRSFDFAPAKDTLQIPQNGYAIIRTPLDNAGAWIFHCHINYHVEIGMAMVLQIGELGGKHPLDGQDWCTGHLEQNTACKTPPPSPRGGPASIYWYYGMEPVKRCVKPGMQVTWLWENKDHNVNNITKENFNSCNVNNSIAYSGDYVWTAPTELLNISEFFYFACGRFYNATTQVGDHCRNGNMRARIKVSNSCP